MNFGDPRLPDRFWSKCTPEPMSGCWLWLASTNRAGYGTFGIGSRTDGSKRSGCAHRVAYEALVGAISAGLECDHRCRVRCCVNPAHIEPVTRSENQLRGEGPSMLAIRNSSITQCRDGHVLTAANTYVAPGSGKRQCRACNRRRARMRRKAAP